MWAFLLYALPLAARLSLLPEVTWWEVLVATTPLMLVMPSLLLPRCVRDEEWEHVVRHAAYAAAFSVSIVACVRWEAVSLSEPWGVALLLYLSVGCATLWWFCASHVLENRLLGSQVLRTHQGDIAVLPLTLVAIGTFAEQVPDEAFRVFRSVIFYVPVVVAWATLHFVAHTGFASSRTTTHRHPHFRFYSDLALVVSSAHLLLLEMRAPPPFFQFFPLVASFACQTARRASEPPLLHRGRALGVALVSAGCGVACGWVLSLRLPSVSWERGTAASSVCLVVYSLALPEFCGRRWVFPSACLSALAVLSYLSPPNVRVVDVVGVWSLFYAASTVVGWVGSHATVRRPPHVHPSSSSSRVPAWASCLFAGGGGEEGARWKGSACATLLSRLPAPHPLCPREFEGVWWMEGNPYPMTLVCVHHVTWREDAADGRPCADRLWMGSSILQRPGVLGRLSRCLQSACVLSLEEVDDEWIRTRGSTFPPFNLFASTYWLRRTSDPTILERYVFDSVGRVRWKYRLVRVWDARGPTVHHSRFLLS